jgi:hypothetical protein
VFETNEKPTGTQYTGTAALLILAFIFIPAALIFSRVLGYLSVFLAAAGTALCIVLAWVNRKRHSQLTIPPLEMSNTRSR